MEELNAIVGYMVFILTIEMFGFMDLYGQNFVRRIINMYRRRDELTYKKKLKPFCQRVERMLSQDDIENLQSIKIPEKNDIPWFSRKNTTTHQCCEKYSEEEKNIIKYVSEKVKEEYEKQIQKKLYFMKENKATIYVYHGNTSQHLWHVDPQNLDTIYNVIICIKKVGKISPLQCKDADGKAYSIEFEPGYAAIFNGGTTVHQVPPNDDPESERTVLSLAFTSDPVLAERDSAANNMCTYIEGGNNIKNVLKLVFKIVLINYFASKFSDTTKISPNTLVGLVVVSLLIAKYIPLYFDLRVIGTNRSSSIFHNICLYIIFMIATFSIKGGVLFFTYFMLSDVLFPRSFVEYD